MSAGGTSIDPAHLWRIRVVSAALRGVDTLEGLCVLGPSAYVHYPTAGARHVACGRVLHPRTNRRRRDAGHDLTPTKRLTCGEFRMTTAA